VRTAEESALVGYVPGSVHVALASGDGWRYRGLPWVQS
jgi:hypothetical protein